ncbi:MAG: 4-(cytidine 5'-diphospho)-2-C-methyl-D-erythritol kinase [Flavobacteriaceae bacterium]
MGNKGLGGEFAAAKVNLALHVIGQIADGYHELETLVVFADIGDRLSVVDHEGAGDTFGVSGPFAADVPAGGGNLAVAALRAMRQLVDLPPLSLSLEKNLPVASGMGGGSADAAATLRALARRTGLPLDDPRLQQCARQLGADVPMCLASRPAIARGRGERLSFLPGLPALSAVLVNPGVGVSTPDVFRALQRRENPPLPPLPDPLSAESLIDWLRQTRNDLEAPAARIAPRVGEAIEALDALDGCLLSRMTGSGATCFGLFADADSAGRAAARLAAARPGWWCRSAGLLGYQ